MLKVCLVNNKYTAVNTLKFYYFSLNTTRIFGYPHFWLDSPDNLFDAETRP
jgi:hypothetical protein